MIDVLEKLVKNHSLSLDEYIFLIKNREKFEKEAIAKADIIRKKYYGNKVFIRGLIEISNVCRNDCLYCGIRRSNKKCERYILTREQILKCCDEGYELGFRTFVLQGGEGAFGVDQICSIISEIKSKYTDCAVTLSLGEYTKSEYEKMYKSGADRYLLRHETADVDHYNKLHPKEMSYYNRMMCLENLKKIGFQVGCGFMVGSPYQKTENIARDLKFIEEFSPDMCGIGPFISHKDTPFSGYENGTFQDTVYLLALIRIMKPNILLPATTALGTVSKGGRLLGIKAGANVVMPNLSPFEERKKYMLYDNKKASEYESAQEVEQIKSDIKSIGYEVFISRGDVVKI